MKQCFINKLVGNVFKITQMSAINLLIIIVLFLNEPACLTSSRDFNFFFKFNFQDFFIEIKLTQESKSPGDSTRLSSTVCVLVTKFNKFV